jgi:hypothetical protein
MGMTRGTWMPGGRSVEIGSTSWPHLHMKIEKRLGGLASVIGAVK